MKDAILLVAFGTSFPEAEQAYRQVESRVRDAFPDTEIRWAYSSKKIRRKFEKAGKELPSPELMTAKLMQDGYTHVSVLSLHVIPGIEFHELQVNTSLFAEMIRGIERVTVSRPLLSSHGDCTRVAEILVDRLPPCNDDEGVVLMGHGTAKHPAYALYYALDAALAALVPGIFTGCVMGFPTIRDLLPRIRQQGVTRVHLVPFMAVAGEHARNDMGGNGSNSWKSVLEDAGIACEVHLNGIAEYPEIVDIWMDHLRDARRELVD